MQDRKCPLVASTNVFGRIVNGVKEENACEGKADPKVKIFLLKFL